MLSYSDNDIIVLTDIEKKKAININKTSLHIRPYIPSILSGRILEDSNKLV